MTTKAQTYTKKERNMFLTGMFGQNMIYNIIATGLYFYFQSVICLPALALGIIFAIARVWDAINDPMMGSIVDKTNTKWGKCRPYLIFSPPIICVITILGFMNGNYANASGTVAKVLIITWAAIAYIMWGMSYTAGDVPLWGIISRMSEVEKDRANLISLSRIIASIGAAIIVVSFIAASQAINGASGLNQNEQKGFIIFAVITTIVATILFECAGIGTKERVPVSPEKKTLKENFKLMWTCKPFRRILISGLLRSPLQLMMTVVMTLFTFYYCDGDLTTAFTDPRKLIIVIIVGGGYFLGQFGAMMVCPMLMKKMDVKKIYNLTAFSGVPTALLFVVFLIDPTGLAKMGWVIVDGVLLVLSGIGFGAVNVCQSVMISDCIDYEEYHTGYRPDGVFFSGQSFITKFSAGIASIISGIVYSIVGYSDQNADMVNKALAQGKNFAVDFSSYSWAMWFLLTIPPAIGLAIAVIPTLKYEITKESHEEMLAELVKRHSELENADNLK